MTFTTNTPKCSYCGYEFDEEETWHGEFTVGKVNTGDSEDSRLKCPNDDCGEIFYARCDHHIVFVSVDDEGDEI